jgi:hypothetical protein
MRGLTKALDRRTLPGSVFFEARTVAAFIRLAMIRIMLKQLVANPLS